MFEYVAPNGFSSKLKQMTLNDLELGRSQKFFVFGGGIKIFFGGYKTVE